MADESEETIPLKEYTAAVHLLALKIKELNETLRGELTQEIHVLNQRLSYVESELENGNGNGGWSPPGQVGNGN